jgi:hypothetical protein
MYYRLVQYTVQHSTILRYTVVLQGSRDIGVVLANSGHLLVEYVTSSITSFNLTLTLIK